MEISAHNDMGTCSKHDMVKYFCAHGLKVDYYSKDHDLRVLPIRIPKIFLVECNREQRFIQTNYYAFDVYSIDQMNRVSITKNAYGGWYSFESTLFSYMSITNIQFLNSIILRLGGSDGCKVYLFRNFLLPSFPNLTTILLLTKQENFLCTDIWIIILKLILRLDYWDRIGFSSLN